MGDNCFICFSKGKTGKTLWGCNKCNFLVCGKCSTVTQNFRTCSRCREKQEKQATLSQEALPYDDLPVAFLRRVLPQQQPTPSFVDHHVLQSSGVAPSTSSANNSDRKVIEDIERRLRKLQGAEPPNNFVSGPKCGMCNAAAVFRCPECLRLAGSGVQELYCSRCLAITHTNNETFNGHKPVSV